MDFEKVLASFAGGVGILFGFMFGPLPYIMSALMFAVVLDYFTGIVAASVQGLLDPKVGFVGIFKKIFIFCMIALAHILDKALNQQVLMSGAILFYLSMEGISIFKNFVVLKVPVPTIMIKAFDGFPKE